MSTIGFNGFPQPVKDTKIGGKRRATGTIQSGATVGRVTVSGLSFLPSMFVVRRTADVSVSSGVQGFTMRENGTIMPSNGMMYADTTNVLQANSASVNVQFLPDGFSFYAYLANTNYTWLAYE